MKNIFTLITAVLCLNFIGYGQWMTLGTDVAGDGDDTTLLDGTLFEVNYDKTTDSIHFRITCDVISTMHSTNLGTNLLVRRVGVGGDKFTFWGFDNQNPYHYLATTWVTGTAPSSYTGDNGICDSLGVNTNDYENIHSQNIKIYVDTVAKTITLSMKRDQIAPDAWFAGDTAQLYIAAAVGSDIFWNDDILGSNYTIDKSVTTGLETLPQINISVSPNPVSETLSVHTNSSLDPHSTITLRDMTGRILVERRITGIGNETIDVQHLAQGLYLVVIENENGIISSEKVQVVH